MSILAKAIRGECASVFIVTECSADNQEVIDKVRETATAQLQEMERDKGIVPSGDIAFTVEPYNPNQRKENHVPIRNHVSR